jgi:DNA polymerase-3 subunit beta
MLDKTQAAFTAQADFPSADLFAAFNRLLHACGQEKARYYLKGAFLHRTTEGKTALVATDGHRLCRHMITAELPADFPAIIIPSQTIKDVLAAMRKTKAHRRPWLVRLEASRTAGRFTVAAATGDENVSIDFVPVDGTFPDYVRVIPRGPVFNVPISREDLEKAVSAVHGFGSALDTQAVRLRFTEGKLTLQASHPMGMATAAIESKDIKPEAEFDIGFNSRYLLDFTKTLDATTVVFHLTDAGSPTILGALHRDHETYILMPMRV